MRLTILLIGIFYLVAQIALTVGCKHEPILDDDLTTPIDTTDPGDTTTIDTTTPGDTCDPDLVYFDLEILPILNSNCAFAGCHNAASAQEGVVLEDYESVMATADVTPFDLGESKIFELLTETDPDKRMPPPPAAALAQDQIQLIAKWISQGAKDLECDPTVGVCDTLDVSFSQAIAPILQATCVGCHSGAAPSGNVSLSNYNGVKIVADDGRLTGVTSWATGFKQMPQGGNQLPDCSIEKIKSWVEAGAQNN